MSRENQEPDYLVAPKHKAKKATFKSAVKRAYKLEHGCTTDKGIAAKVGLGPSRISQIFKADKPLDSEPIRKLLLPLKSPRNRYEIVSHWLREQHGINLPISPPEDVLGAEITRETIQLLFGYLKAHQPARAIRTARQALNKTENPEFQEAILDVLLMGNLRLGHVGRAMSYARIIAERARTSGNKRREAKGHFWRAMLLMSLTDCKISEVEMAVTSMRDMLASADPLPRVSPGYSLIDDFEATILSLRVQIHFSEKGLVKVDEPKLRKNLHELSVLKRKTKSKWKQFNLSILEGRIHLILNEDFKAHEILEEAYRLKAEEDLHALDMCDVLLCRVKVRLEPPAVVSNFIWEVLWSFDKNSDHYNSQMLEHDLARIQHSMFPPSRPVV